VLLVIAGLAVVAIALVAVGRVTAKMAAAPPLSYFEEDEAIDWVADRLSFDTSAELSYDDVGACITAYVDYLELKGVATESRPDDDDRVAGPIVTADDEGLAFVLGRIGDANLSLDDVQVAEVIERTTDYLRAIGAVGNAVPSPVDPDSES
jgi:hypothetical protein